MALPALFRRRSIWLPTVRGWLAALALALALAWIVLHHVHDFLAPDEPVAAELLVVEGWMAPEELREAVQLVRSEGYRRVVTTGGPLQGWGERLAAPDYASLARQFLIEQGLEPDTVIAVPAPASAQSRTYLSAVMVREWARAQVPPPRELDVLSVGVHSRRTWRMYELALGDSIEVGIRSAEPTEYEAREWWRSSYGGKVVVGECLSWVWSVLFFHPPEPGTHEELWGG